ncbi:MAG: NTPase [Candidatus Eisenbacteria bacterium]|nr:NTPase [Candidatus Eisenbacteria bacterium]
MKERSVVEDERVSLRRNLFVTGRPGVGKTTLIEKVLERLDVRAGGFYTREIREGGKRVGFSIVGMDGERGVLAHVGIESEHRVGKYGVDREDLERVGVAALESAIEEADLVVMDEIGRMELCSPLFRDAVIRALDCPGPVLGTIQDRSNEFLDGVRSRDDVSVVRVTEENRDELADALADAVGKTLAADARGPRDAEGGGNVS